MTDTGGKKWKMLVPGAGPEETWCCGLGAWEGVEKGEFEMWGGERWWTGSVEKFPWGVKGEGRKAFSKQKGGGGGKNDFEFTPGYIRKGP